MHTTPTIRTGRAARLARGAAAVLVLMAAAATLAGCLGKPPIEDQWTRLDVESSTLRPNQSVPPSAAESVQVVVRITYRSIVTGFAVAELRVADSLGVADVVLSPDAPRVPMAHDIDRILAGSRTLGRATRAVTGWDHLIQPLDLRFSAATPPDTGGIGARGLFLVCYMGSGDEIQLPGNRDSLVITPFNSDQYRILPVGMELSLTPVVP